MPDRLVIDSNRLGNLDMEPGSWPSDSLGVAVVEYWERHVDKPEDSPADDERGGWSRWALDKAEACLARWAAELDGMNTPPPSPESSHPGSKDGDGGKWLNIGVPD